MSILIPFKSEGINYWWCIASGRVSTGWIILAFTTHIYNYRAELEMTDKTWANSFSHFIKHISQLRALTEQIPVTSPSSLDYVIEFRWSTFIQVMLCKNFVWINAFYFFFFNTDWYNILVLSHWVHPVGYKNFGFQ